MDTAAVRRPLTLLAAAALVAVVALLAVMVLGGPRGVPTAAALPAQDAPAAPAPSAGITVDGRGTVTGRPDVMDLQLSVQASAPDADAALARMSRTYDVVRGALTRGGVTSPDLQTSDLSLYPTRKKGVPGITGYRASESLTATVRDLTGAGKLVTRVVGAGGSAVRLQGISFGIEQDGALLAAARDRAFASARTKAEAYARSAGRPLGTVVSVTEGGRLGTGRQLYTTSAAASYAKDVARIDTGSQQLSVDVTVQWSFGG